MTYSFEGGGYAVVTFEQVEAVLDGFGSSVETVRVREAVTRDGQTSETTYWVDLETRIILRRETGSETRYFQPYYEWFRREQIQGYAPYLLPLVLGEQGFPLHGERNLTLLGQEIHLAGDAKAGMVHLTIRFPHQEAPDLPNAERQTTLRLDMDTGLPDQFGDLLALGTGFAGAQLTATTRGQAPIPWKTPRLPDPGRLHPEASAAPLRSGDALPSQGLALSGADAVQVAQLTPAYAEFAGRHEHVYVGAAFYEPTGEVGRWTIQFTSSKAGPSYGIESERLDIEVFGRSTMAGPAALPVRNGDLKEFFEPLFDSRFAGLNGRSTLDHALAWAASNFGNELHFSFVEQCDPERWPGAEEVVMTVISPAAPNKAMSFSGVNGQLLYERLPQA